MWASTVAAVTRNSLANLADPTPTGAPRRRQPSTSSTGMGGSVGLGALAIE